MNSPRFPVLVACLGSLPWVALAAPAGGPSPRVSVIPQPARLEEADGGFRLGRRTVVAAAGAARGEGEFLAVALRRPTGLRLALVDRPPARDCIRLELDAALAGRLGDEGYLLKADPRGVVLRAATVAGLFYGGVTMRQILPADVFDSAPAGPRASGRWIVPAVTIEDQPRFRWRGLLLDVARHYQPPEFVKRLVDLLALHKLNSLQLHLTDDQGWRIEITKYPRLTTVGSQRKESPRRGDRDRGDATPYGPHFYTQAEIREMVAYAAARHVTLVPEVELPGHFRAALAAYPELSCTGGPFEVRTRWGIEPDILCAGNDTAVAFAFDVLGEVMELFPSRFIHIGGDEAPRERWRECPKCQARIRAEGLKNEPDLQGYLNRRLEQFLASRGRRLIGWDEILEGGLAPAAAVMSWRGMEGGIAAARAGHDVVMSPTSHCYFDYAQSKAPGEPEAIGGYVPLETVYGFQPVPSSLAPADQDRILGVQGNLWTEYLRTPGEVEYFAFPRAAALAEVAWSPISARDFEMFQRRLRVHLTRLDRLGVNYRRLALP